MDKRGKNKKGKRKKRLRDKEMETLDNYREEFLNKANYIEKLLEELARELEEKNNIEGIGVREILSTVHKRFDEIFDRNVIARNR